MGEILVPALGRARDEFGIAAGVLGCVPCSNACFDQLLFGASQCVEGGLEAHGVAGGDALRPRGGDLAADAV
ncbi:hypothetical protein [Nocardia sp. NPDC047648]|uniref:hypothetical protein n=1 Tax=Nocardia sp. NPDC047648 TaxID=3155625 RepID=UPI003411DBB8